MLSGWQTETLVVLELGSGTVLPIRKVLSLVNMEVNWTFRRVAVHCCRGSLSGSQDHAVTSPSAVVHDSLFHMPRRTNHCLYFHIFWQTTDHSVIELHVNLSSPLLKPQAPDSVFLSPLLPVRSQGPGGQESVFTRMSQGPSTLLHRRHRVTIEGINRFLIEPAVEL